MRDNVGQHEVIAKGTFLSVTLSDSSFLSVPRNSLTFISALNGAPCAPTTAIFDKDYIITHPPHINEVMIKNRSMLYLYRASGCRHPHFDPEDTGMRFRLRWRE